MHKIFFAAIIALIMMFVFADNSAYALPNAGDTGQSAQTGTDTGATTGSGQTASGSSPLAEGLSEFGGFNTGLRTQGGVIEYIATIIRWALGLVGTVFFVLVIIAGTKYMTAGGNAQQSQQAISSITNAVIGLVIIMGAFLLTNFVTSALLAGGGSGDSSSLPHELTHIMYG